MSYVTELNEILKEYKGEVKPRFDRSDFYWHVPVAMTYILEKMGSIKEQLGSEIPPEIERQFWDFDLYFNKLYEYLLLGRDDVRVTISQDLTRCKSFLNAARDELILLLG